MENKIVPEYRRKRGNRKAVQLWLTLPDYAAIEKASEQEHQNKTQFITHHAVKAAKKLLGAS